MRSEERIFGTGFRTCDCCGETYDYAPDSPSHVCAATPHLLEVEREMIRDQILFPKLREFGGCMGQKARSRQDDCERGNCECAQLADTLIHDIAFWSPVGGSDNS